MAYELKKARVKEMSDPENNKFVWNYSLGSTPIAVYKKDNGTKSFEWLCDNIAIKFPGVECEPAPVSLVKDPTVHDVSDLLVKMVGSAVSEEELVSHADLPPVGDVPDSFFTAANLNAIMAKSRA